MFKTLSLLEAEAGGKPFFSAKELKETLPKDTVSLLQRIDDFIMENLPENPNHRHILAALSQATWHRDFQKATTQVVKSPDEKKALLLQSWLEKGGRFSVKLMPCFCSNGQVLPSTNLEQMIELSFHVDETGVRSAWLNLFKAQEDVVSFKDNLAAQKKESFNALRLMRHVQAGNYVDLEKVRAGCFEKAHHLDLDVDLNRALVKEGVLETPKASVRKKRGPKAPSVI